MVTDWGGRWEHNQTTKHASLKWSQTGEADGNTTKHASLQMVTDWGGGWEHNQTRISSNGHRLGRRMGTQPNRHLSGYEVGLQYVCLLALQPQNHDATTVMCTVTPGLRETEERFD